MRHTALLLAALTSCRGGAVHDEHDTIRVSVIDRDKRPLADAMVWTISAKAWKDRRWIPSELFPWFGNPHELLRRLGREAAVDSSGAVHVPRGTVLAGECGELAGMATVDDEADHGSELVLDRWRWTIVVRDEKGAPVARVPVGCRPETETETDCFEGIPLGLTDAQGRLVVRDPASVRVASFVPQPVNGPEPRTPAFVAFEVEGMYFRPHSAKLPLHAGASGTATLELPPVTKIEVRLPEWDGPIDTWVTMTRLGKNDWDDATCWSESGKLYGLVGAPERTTATPILVRVDESSLRTDAYVPRLPPSETFPITIALAENDAVVRARLHDADGRTVRRAMLRVTSATATVRIPFVQADVDGRIALVLDSNVADGASLDLVVEAASVETLIGTRGELRLSNLTPGERRDVGAVRVSRSP